MIFETGLSTLNISRAKRAPNTINFVDMRLVLVFLATFLQSLANVGSCCFKPTSTDAEKTKSPI